MRVASNELKILLNLIKLSLGLEWELYITLQTECNIKMNFQ